MDVYTSGLSEFLAAAAAAKSLQSCPTLCDPIDGSPPGSPVPGILQGRKNTGVGCHFLLRCMKVKSESEVAQLCPALRDHMDCSLPGSLSMGFSRQEYWSGLPLPSPMEVKTKVNKWDLIKPRSFCTTKDTISKVKRQPSEWEKTIANETTDKQIK